MSSKSRSKLGKFKSSLLLKQPFEWTEKQKQIVETMNDKSTTCVFVDGAAGTGKTSLAVYSALHHLQHGLIDKIYYMRSAVESSHSKLGSLPGDLDQKSANFTATLLDGLQKFLTDEEIKNFIDSRQIESVPLAFLRGRDLQNCIIILDEFQNVYFDELVTVFTRVGHNFLTENFGTGSSKIFAIGDQDQSDLNNGHKSDSRNFTGLFKGEDSKNMGIHTFYLGPEEIKRSPFVRHVVEKVLEYRKNNTKS